MTWETIGAIAGIFAFGLTLFLEWPKLTHRIKGIPPIYFSRLGLGIFYLACISSVAKIVNTIGLGESVYIFVAINIVANVSLLIVTYWMTRQLSEEHNPIPFFIYWGLLIYLELLYAFYKFAQI